VVTYLTLIEFPLGWSRVALNGFLLSDDSPLSVVRIVPKKVSQSLASLDDQHLLPSKGCFL